MTPSSDILQELRIRLDVVRRRILGVEILSHAFFCASAVLACVFGLVLIDAVAHLDRIGRTAGVLVSISGSAALIVLFILIPILKLTGFLRRESDEKIASAVGTFFPNVQDRILNALQIDTEAKRSRAYFSADLIHASLSDLWRDVQDLDFVRTVDRSPVRKERLRFFAILGFAVLFALLFPGSITSSAHRLLHFRTEFVVPAQYSFDVHPGNVEVAKGSAVEISVRVRAIDGAPVSDRELHLLHRPEGQDAYDDLVLRADSSKEYRASLQSVRSSTDYFIRMEDVGSPHFRLSVFDRPVIRSLRVRLEYPSYTHLPPVEQDEFVGDISALPGTRVIIQGRSSKTLRGGKVDFRGGKSLALAVEGEAFRAAWTMTKDDEYGISVTDEENLQNVDPVNYRMKIIPDDNPSVAIVEPGRNLDLASNQSVNLLMEAKDDFGFTSMRIGYRLSKSRYEQPASEYSFLPVDIARATGTEIEVPFAWDLQSLKLVPEDELEYFAEVFDNDVVSGPKSARSALFLIRLPSLDEVFSEVDKGHEESVGELKETLEETKKLKEELESIDRDLKNNKDVDWQQQKRVEEMGKKYGEVEKKLKDVQSKVDRLTEQMQNQNVLSKETLDKYLELQSLMEQMNSTELGEALKKMQQAMQTVSKEQLQRALQSMQFSEERFRQSIERTLNLLKRIQIEQKLDEVKKRAEELAEEQKELASETPEQGKSPGNQESLAKRQEDLAGKEGSMEKSSEELQKRMEEFFTEMPADKLGQVNQKLRDQAPGEKMRNASKQIREGQSSEAQRMQQEALEQVQDFGKEVDSLQQEMMQRQSQHVMNELRKSIRDLLELSEREKGLKQQSQNAPPNSPQLRQNAEQQLQEMQDLGNVVTRLSELGQRSFAITPEMGKAVGEALARMNNAMRNLDTRSGGNASLEQAAAMAALNQSAVEVDRSLQSMMQGGQGGAGGGLLGQLQAMAGKQRSINMETMSMQGAAEAARLAQEQEAVRKSLEQLNREAQESGEQKRVMGDLEKISDEMKEVVRNLEQDNVNPETIQKQERILSRLLDASKSQRERDYENKRKSESGTQIAGKSPKELDANALNAKDRLQEDLLKALEQKYSRDYQELIRRYFEELEKMGQSEIQR